MRLSCHAPEPSAVHSAMWRRSVWVQPLGQSPSDDEEDMAELQEKPGYE